MVAGWTIPYATSTPLPYWGAPTSAVNFCEEDYIITHYVAEFFNAITSLAYVAYGIRGIRRFRRKDVSPISAVNLPYWGLISIGICSGIYHSTLKYHTQMADETSMHTAMGCVLIQVFNFQKPLHTQRRNSLLISTGLISFVIYHCITDEFVIHVILILGLSVTVGQKTRSIIKTTVKNPAHRKKMSSFATLSTCIALFGYFLWNLDVNFCVTLTRWKRQLGLPWGVLLELHGWWHILTSISTYNFMALIEFLTFPDYVDTHGVGFAWPAKSVLEGLLPEKVPGANGVVDAVKKVANGHVINGASKRAD